MKESSRVATIIGIVLAISSITVGVYELVPRATQSGTCHYGVDRLAPADGAPPLGFGGSVDSTKGLTHWYNFSVESASDCYYLGILSFQVQVGNGSAAPLPSGSGVAVAAPTGSIEAVFTFEATWTYEPGFSSNTLLTTQNILSLFYTGSTPSSLVGDTFAVLSSRGSCSGPIT